MQNSFIKRKVRCVKKLKKKLRAISYLYLIKYFGKTRKIVETFVGIC